MSAPPFMQLYVADYLGDTRHLTTEQHGAYLLLLMTMWRAGGSLPNDPKKLARVAGCGPSRWAKIGEDVMAFFEVYSDQIVSARLSQELEKASQKSIKRAEAGSKGGAAKSLKTRDGNVAIATRLPKHSPEPELERREAIASLLSDPFDEFWSAYPRKIGKPKAKAAYQSALRRCTGPPAIIAGLTLWVAVWTDPQFIPHPTTWLNRDGWDDIPPEAHERPHHNPTNAADRRRADTESRRNAWAPAIAERTGGDPRDDERGESGGGDRDFGGHLRLAHLLAG